MIRCSVFLFFSLLLHLATAIPLGCSISVTIESDSESVSDGVYSPSLLGPQTVEDWVCEPHSTECPRHYRIDTLECAVLLAENATGLFSSFTCGGGANDLQPTGGQRRIQVRPNWSPEFGLNSINIPFYDCEGSETSRERGGLTYNECAWGETANELASADGYVIGPFDWPLGEVGSITWTRDLTFSSGVVPTSLILGEGPNEIPSSSGITLDPWETATFTIDCSSTNGGIESDLGTNDVDNGGDSTDDDDGDLGENLALFVGLGVASIALIGVVGFAIARRTSSSSSSSGKSSPRKPLNGGGGGKKTKAGKSGNGSKHKQPSGTKSGSKANPPRVVSSASSVLTRLPLNHQT